VSTARQHDAELHRALRLCSAPRVRHRVRTVMAGRDAVSS
jgi:hypothetical protein